MITVYRCKATTAQSCNAATLTYRQDNQVLQCLNVLYPLKLVAEQREVCKLGELA